MMFTKEQDYLPKRVMVEPMIYLGIIKMLKAIGILQMVNTLILFQKELQMKMLIK